MQSQFYVILFEDLLLIPSVEETLALPAHTGQVTGSLVLRHRFSTLPPSAQQSWVLLPYSGASSQHLNCVGSPVSWSSAFFLGLFLLSDGAHPVLVA